MNYKKDKRYIISRIISGLSIVDIFVSFILMGFGNDKAIVSFYAGLPFLCVASFMAVAVKMNYARAERLGIDPDPPFYRIRNAYAWAKEAGFFKTLTTALTIVLSGVLAVLLVVCGYYAYTRSAILHFPDYVKNETKYNEYYELWVELRSNGEEEQAHDIYTIMEQYHNDNAQNRMRIGIYENKLKKVGKWTLGVAIADIVSLAAFVTVRVYYKRRELKELGSGDTE